RANKTRGSERRARGLAQGTTEDTRRLRARAGEGSVGTRVGPIVINLRRGRSGTMPVASDGPAGVIGGVETGVDNLRGPGSRQRQHDGDPQTVVEHVRSDASTGNADMVQ